MACSICNEEGHNARTCSKKQLTENETSDRNNALWIKFDNLIETEANELLKNSIDAKSKIAPQARGTFAKGNKKELPNKINEALALQKPKDTNG